MLVFFIVLFIALTVLPIRVWAFIGASLAAVTMLAVFLAGMGILLLIGSAIFGVR